MKTEDLKFDCRFFKGGIPCTPNKLRNKECSTCDEYSKITKRILIIKLGALGDVIRTTPLVTKFRKEYPGCAITWVTLSPDILPKEHIEEILPFDFQTVYNLTHRQFDIAINLDKETEACALLSDVNATKKFGFIWKDGHISTATSAAEHKLITGAFDHISKKNTKNYLEEIFEICGFKFNDEEYLLSIDSSFQKKWLSIKEKAGNKKIIGLNTGCGNRWQTRLWPESCWLELIVLLQKKGFYPVLLGGKDEDARNLSYASTTGAYYPGNYGLKEFIALTSHCDLVVTAVSMMMHIATGLQKPLILFNNIFNKHEFYLYNRGAIVEPETGCDCFYGVTCTRPDPCMNHLPATTVFKAICGQMPDHN